MKITKDRPGQSFGLFPIISVALLFAATVPAFAQTDENPPQNDDQISNAVDGAVEDDVQPEPSADATSSEQLPEDEGANSFDTLCGNGQGKPKEGEVRKKRKGIFGIADKMSSLTRKIPVIGDIMVDSANSLSQAVACRLYPEEQEQAAEATEEAVRGAEIGKTVKWESTVRDNVSGSSTVAAKTELANGTPCLTVADIIIVDGEELRVSKQMCRLPGASRYTIMQA